MKKLFFIIIIVLFFSTLLTAQNTSNPVQVDGVLYLDETEGYNLYDGYASLEDNIFKWIAHLSDNEYFIILHNTKQFYDFVIVDIQIGQVEYYDFFTIGEGSDFDIDFKWISDDEGEKAYYKLNKDISVYKNMDKAEDYFLIKKGSYANFFEPK